MAISSRKLSLGGGGGGGGVGMASGDISGSSTRPSSTDLRMCAPNTALGGGEGREGRKRGDIGRSFTRLL